MKGIAVRMAGAAALAVSLGSCMTSADGDGRSAARDDSGESIYYNSQAAADAALEAFDKTNPSCQLWTNWQKMCSRTGENGATWCTTDPARPVRPSTPFCVDMRHPQQSISPVLAEESRRRFCSKARKANNVTYDFEANKAVSKGGGLVCEKYQTERPFNGENVSARQHPLCSNWSKHNSGKLFCTNWKKFSCYLEDGVPRKEPTNDAAIVIPTKFNPEAITIFGVACS